MKSDCASFLKDVEYRDPVFAGRFHTDFVTVIFGEPGSQITQAFRKRRKAILAVDCASVGISNTDAGIDPGFVDIKATTIFAKDFKHWVPPTANFVGLTGTGHLAKSSQLRKR